MHVPPGLIQAKAHSAAVRESDARRARMVPPRLYYRWCVGFRRRERRRRRASGGRARTGLNALSEGTGVAEGIIAAAKDKGCDLIVMASHGRRGAARLLLGSQAYEVLANSSVPVPIVR
jgi:Universal stress protein family